MKITVINNRPSGGDAVPCVDGTQVEPGETHEMLARSAEELIYMMGQADGNTVLVLGQIEGNDRAPIVNVMKKPADPAGGAATLAGVGFDLMTEAGVAANVNPQMYMGVFDDAACTIPSVTGQLSTATVGTIDEGTGTNLIKCTPDATGDMTLSVDDAADEIVYLKAWPVGTGYIIDSSDIDSVEFTA